MTSGFDPGALMARYYVLPSGLRVCLRLARPRDEGGVGRLLSLAGHEPDELGLARLVRFDPVRVSIVATALLGGVVALVGIGVIERGSEVVDRPELLVVDPAAGDGLEQLLCDALLGRAAALARNRVA